MNRLQTISKVLAPVLLSILLVTACGGPSGPESPQPPAPPETAPASAGNPVEGDWLIERLDSEPTGLNPLLSTTGGDGMYVASQAIEAMIDLDNETLEYVPRLAKSWEIAEDHLTYTFHLRDDVFFHDGVKFTAEDVKFSFDAVNDPKNDTMNARNYIQDIDTIEILDDYTIQFKMKQPYFRNLLVLGAMDVLPKHIYGKGEFNKHPNNRHPIGTGPYVFDSWKTGQQITLVKNENYWGDPVYLEKRMFNVITDSEVAFQVFEKRELGMMRMEATQWVSRAATPEFEAKFAKYATYSMAPGYVGHIRYIAWNMRKPQFADKRVRRALTMLIDRDMILREIYHGMGTVVSGDFSPKVPEYNQAIKPWPFDPVEAMRLLDEAGWIDADRDGVREKDGLKLEFEFSFTATIDEYVRMSAIYQQELERAGIKVTIRPLEWAAFSQRVHERRFDACMLSWVLTPEPDPYQVWHSSQAETGSNYPGFKNEEADRIMEEARREFDHEKRIEMYHRFHEILHEEQPYTFLMSNNGLFAVDRRFQNVRNYVPGLDAQEWWVPLAMQRYK